MQDSKPSSSRRDFLRGAIGLGVAAAAVGCTNQTDGKPQQNVEWQPKPGEIIMRPIPKSGERLPVIGLGTFMTFDVLPGQPREHLREVMRRYWDAGVRVFDTSPLYGMGEVNVGDFAAALDIAPHMFITNKIWSTGEYLADDSHAERSLDNSMQRLWRERIDAMQCHNLVNVDVVVPLLQKWKRQGRIRYIGVSHHDTVYFPALAHWIERGHLDFVQVRYSIATRQAEERILRAAADHGTAVIANMPFEKARLFQIVEGHALPDFARDIDAENWAQFFLKWVISHPAIACVLPATSNPDHAAENVGALRGKLPDPDMRLRMLRHMETIPGFDRIESMPWYPGKRYPGVIARSQEELRATT